MIRTSLTFGAIAWHQPQTTIPLTPTGVSITDKLAKQQNKCIHIVPGVYKATPTSTVEAEVFTFIPPPDLYLDSVVSGAARRLNESRMAC